MAAPEEPQARDGGRQPLSRNVRLTYYLTFVLLTIWSFSFGATFDAYLQELAKRRNFDPNSFVGAVESARGLVGLALAWPLGLLSDKVNRRRMFGVSSFFGTAGVAMLGTGVYLDSVPILIAGVVTSAIFMQCYMSTSGALLADSVPKERMTEVMAWQGTLSLIGTSAGPLAQIALISFVGDTWSIDDLHKFIIAGFCFWPLALPPFFMLERTLVEREADLRASLLLEGQGQAAPEESPTPSNGPGTPSLTPPATVEWLAGDVFCFSKKWFVPCLIELCSLITALGAGMTVKFFPLFFKEDYSFSPIQLNILNASYTVAIAIFVQLCRGLAAKIGRCQAVLLFHVTGTACLFLLWKAQPLWQVVACFVVRGAFMNAMGPINQAIVMDCVDSKFRGRWSALQSISRFSWSGSAFLGGWLSDAHDYRFTFFITALIYSTSAVFYLPMLALVPGKQDASLAAGRRADSAQEPDGTAAEGTIISLQPGQRGEGVKEDESLGPQSP